MAKSQGRVFISYRRRDTRYLAGRLNDTLAAQFGEDQVFMDVDAIEPGLDFAEEIAKAVAACDVLLAVIGPGWLTITDPAGRRRLDNPADFVRIEIETALNQNIRIIPVLTDDAKLPQADDLPETLAPLIRRQAIVLRHDRYRDDVRKLLEVLDRILAPRALGRVPNVPPVKRVTTEPRSVQRTDTNTSPNKLRHSSMARNMVFSPDGTLLATTTGNSIHIWELVSRQKRHSLHHSGWVFNLGFSPDSTLLATAASDDACHIWDPATGEEHRRLPHDEPVTSVVFSPDGTLLATTARDDDTAYLWDPATGEVRRRLHHATPVTKVVFSPDDALLATTADAPQTDVHLWDPATGTEHSRLNHAAPVTGVVFSPDGALLATTANNSNTAFLWDPVAGEIRRRIKHEYTEVGLTHPITSIVFSADGTLIATVAHNSPDVLLWSVADAAAKERPLKHISGVNKIIFSPDGTLLATMASTYTTSDTAFLWDTSGREYRRFSTTREILFSPDGTLLATASEDGTVRLRRLDDLIGAA